MVVLSVSVCVVVVGVVDMCFSGDVCLGANIMKQVSESYRKLRNTLRYLVGSLDDFVPATHAVPIEQLPSIDR